MNYFLLYKNHGKKILTKDKNVNFSPASITISLFLLYLVRTIGKQGLFAFCLLSFSHVLSTRMIFFVNFTDHFVPLLLESIIYHLVNSLFRLGRFLILLRNVFSRTETTPVRVKQIGQ